MARAKTASIETILGISEELAAERVSLLTERESEVAAIMATGEKGPTIAKKLGISPKTLAIHRATIKRKLEARTSVDVARTIFAAKFGEL